ncbi:MULTISPECIES: competence protein ComK [Neobacillus]|uniref:Competence protein ComK n=2 Tax=Neobacillus citreus TaxID=2833578 RepID=A0A9J6MV07_9BACI|nr:competence protein ComK [Neobacillus citreus]MCH6265251.1 competence protein ComK [Neobacillus citreus]
MKKQIEEYEINSCTMFLAPMEYGSKVYTKIIEVDDEFISPFKPLDIIKKSCDYFGVDYESRKKGTRQLIGYSRKIPIAIEPANHIFFFPTTSPSRPECIWISHEHVENYRRLGPHQTQVTFQNKQTHLFSVSFGTIEGQMLRTALLKTKLLQRIEGNKKMTYLFNAPKPIKASEHSHDYK